MHIIILEQYFKELGENQKAKNCYEKAIEINPNYADAHNNLGTVFNELGENQKAKNCYEKAIEINPNYADAHNNLGNVYKIFIIIKNPINIITKL